MHANWHDIDVSVDIHCLISPLQVRANFSPMKISHASDLLEAKVCFSHSNRFALT